MTKAEWMLKSLYSWLVAEHTRSAAIPKSNDTFVAAYYEGRQVQRELVINKINELGMEFGDEGDDDE